MLSTPRYQQWPSVMWAALARLLLSTVDTTVQVWNAVELARVIGDPSSGYGAGNGAAFGQGGE